MRIPKVWRVDKIVSIERRSMNAQLVKCRARGGRKLDSMLKKIDSFCRREVYVESARGSPRRLKLFDAFLSEHSNFDGMGTRTIVFNCHHLEKVEMKIPKMWGAA